MKKKIAVFMLFGQSNAVGHRADMAPEDIIDTPMKNVFGLNREPNQSLESQELIFSGYTSAGMNLAETQDHTYSLANCLARLWQDEIDAGNPNDLTDLYIIQIAIGSQGLYNMWNPDREPILIPGKLGMVNISLYPYAVHILKLFRAYLEEKDLEPEFVGLHWRGGEQDTSKSIELLERELKGLYERVIGGLCEAVGYPVPVVFHKMPFKSWALKSAPDGEKLRRMEFINGLFEELSRERGSGYVFDVEKLSIYDPSTSDYGLLRPDWIHYTGAANRAVTAEIFRRFKEEREIELRERTEEHVRLYYERTQEKEIRALLPSAADSLETALRLYHESRLPSARSMGKTIYYRGEYVGDVWCYGLGEEEPDAMLSYCLFEKRVWGKGIATRAVKRFLDQLCATRAIKRIGAFTYCDNLPSVKLLTSLGFRLIEGFEEEGRLSAYYEWSAE